MAREGKVRPDDAQIRGLKELERLHQELLREDTRPGSTPAAGGWLSSLFGTGSSTADPPPPAIQGVYLHGGPGCGKTFIMDLFFDGAPVQRKRRTHFHAFMLEVHDRLHRLRKAGGSAEVTAVADAIMEDNGRLFCFDEFNVTDIGDAMILRVLLERMVAKGAVLVTTSNRYPRQLYRNGLQRELFLPCIELIMERCVVHDMDSQVDYRLLGTDSSASYILTEATSKEEADAQLNRTFRKLAKERLPHSIMLHTQGRKLRVPRMASGVADFRFEQLCGQPLGAADFLALATAFHAIILRGIPKMNAERMAEVRRLITLVDVLYDHRVKLLCSAAAEPFQLLEAEEGSLQDEVFAFDRAASRLQEMQSEQYLLQSHRPPPLPDASFPFIKSLSPESLDALWENYDEDGNGTIDLQELQHLLEDVYEAKVGHRFVPDDVLQDTMKAMDTNGDGVISRTEFRVHCETTGLSVWYWG